jgi:SAM-dependent methyltransferase
MPARSMRSKFHRREKLTMKQLVNKIFVLVLVLSFALPVWAQETTIPFVPSPMVVVDRMLALAEVEKDDIIYDLGSGDGRILIQAAKKYGARGIGIDLDPQRVAEARQKAKEEGVSHLVEFRAEDGTQTDISKATVVTLYMFKWFNNAIKPKLQKLKPGSRIVAHDYDIDDWKPTTVLQLEPTKDPGIERHHTLYLWKVGIESAQR